MWMTHGLKSKKRERADRGPTRFIRLTCTYSTPLWQCFLRNWKTFLTTFSTSWKGCWIWGWTKGVKWTTPTSTYSERKSRQRGVSTDLKTRLQREWSWECGERKWQKKSSQVWWDGECKKQAFLTNGSRYKAGQRERKRERAQHSGIKEGWKAENKMTQHGWLAS